MLVWGECGEGVGFRWQQDVLIMAERHDTLRWIHTGSGDCVG